MRKNPNDNSLPPSHPSAPQTDPASASESLNSNAISSRLEDNLRRIEDYFANCKDLKISPWGYGPKLEQTAFSVYFETLIKPDHKNYLKQTLQNLVAHEIGPATTITVDILIDFLRTMESPPPQLN